MTEPGKRIGIATGYGLDGRDYVVRVPVDARFSLVHVVQIGCEAHPASRPLGSGRFFPGGKAAGPRSGPLTSN
jgi:hypothetical protein